MDSHSNLRCLKLRSSKRDLTWEVLLAFLNCCCLRSVLNVSIYHIRRQKTVKILCFETGERQGMINALAFSKKMISGKLIKIKVTQCICSLQMPLLASEYSNRSLRTGGSCRMHYCLIHVNDVLWLLVGLTSPNKILTITLFLLAISLLDKTSRL